MAITLTKQDKLIIRGLREFPQENLDRLEAHLFAGLPMDSDYGNEGHDTDPSDAPAVVGCIVGVAFSSDELEDMNGLGKNITRLAENWLFDWLKVTGPSTYRSVGTVAFTSKQLDRLGLLVQIEVQRRIEAHRQHIAQLAREKKRVARSFGVKPLPLRVPVGASK